jgi:hypothetical protein
MTIPHETRTPRPNFWLRAIEHRKHQLTREYRATLGDTAREGISDEDYGITMATLEKMARNLGWSEDQRPEAPFGKRRGFGLGHHGHDRRHFGRAHGFGPKRFPTDTPES